MQITLSAYLTYSWPHEPMSPSQPSNLYFKLSWSNGKWESDQLAKPMINDVDYVQIFKQKNSNDSNDVPFPLQPTLWEQAQTVRQPGISENWKTKKREYKLISTLKYKSTNEAAAIMSLIPSSLTLAFARKRF